MSGPGNPYSRWRYGLVYLGWWLFWSLLQTFVLHRLGFSWKIALADSMASNILLGFLASTALLLYRFYQPGAGNRFYRLIYALGITVLFCALLRLILRWLLPAEFDYHEIVERSMPLRFIIAFMVISFITIINWLWNSLEEQRQIVLRNTEAEKLAKEAELVKLRQQLQPHFLFNSLNSVSALLIRQPEQARKMIQQLSDFLRATLRKDESSTVPLSEEMTQLALYLDIEKVRFGNRLVVNVDVAPDALGSQIPPLLLQPLMENAIKFGLYGTLGEVKIDLRAAVSRQMLEVNITNPFDADVQKTRNGTGFGLSSVERRLYLLFGRNDLLSCRSDNGFFTSTLRIPQ